MVWKKTMNKLLILALLSICLNAGQSDNNKTMTDEEFMKQWQQLEQREKEAKKKTAEMKKNTQALDKLEKTVDELGNKLGVDKK